ncbi:Uncharacterised protein [Mycobacteroides abscessus subsp. abscessus]|nr:Uncharacterised protein [Mycobacteroides abscessus subsp. abscessus]
MTAFNQQKFAVSLKDGPAPKITEPIKKKLGSGAAGDPGEQSSCKMDLSACNQVSSIAQDNFTGDHFCHQSKGYAQITEA